MNPPRLAQALATFDAELEDETAWSEAEVSGDFSGARIKGARLHGSTLDDVRGVLDLVGVVIDGNQVVPLGVRVLAALGVGVDEQRES